MVTGIEHVAIASPDPLRLALWYVEHLDFVINYQPASSKTVFIKAADGSMIEIIESAPDTVPAAGMNPAGLRHLALTVADFPEVYARLKGKSVRFLTDAQTTNGNSLAFFTDPDGNVLPCCTAKPPCPSPHSAAILLQTQPKVWRFSHIVTFTSPSASYTCSYVPSLV